MDNLETLLDTTDPLIEEEEVVEDVGLSDEDLRNLCEEEYKNARLSDDVLYAQKKAMRQYFLEPDGNEEDGYSKVQSSDVRDAVESALPILMDMFLSSESPVVFKPARQDDIDQAEQETVFCQYVLNTQNPGILILLQWIKDALLLKNGYVKAFWDGRVDEEREDYEGLDQDQLAAVMADDNYEVISVAEIPPMDPEGMTLFDVEGKRSSDAGQVRILNIPNDRVRISGNWNSIDLTGCPYVCHEEKVSRSDLIVDGFDRDLIEDLPAETDLIEDSETSFDRYRQNTASDQSNATSSDPSRDILTRYEHYIRADRDGDGITELLKVTIIGGDGGTVIDVEEVDAHAIIATTPFVLPHSSQGMSLAEFVGETQEIQTALLRQTLNNLYLTNQPGLAVDVRRTKNPEVLSQPRIGMIIQKEGPEPVAEAIAVPFMAEKSLIVMQAIDQKAEKKTGLSAETTGLDAETLAKSTNMVGAMTLNLAQMRMKLVSSTICETGFKPLMLRIRELVMKHMSRQEMVELGGKWVPIDPRNWREKRNTQIRIGVGTVMKMERQAALNQIISLQKDIVATQGGVEGPFVTAANIYNTLRDIERLTGTMSVDRYFSNPANYTPPTEKPDIASEAIEIEQAKLAEKAQKDAADVEIQHRKLNIEEQKLGLQQQNAVADRARADAQQLREVSHAAA